jgi:hypothetical protein
MAKAGQSREKIPGEVQIAHVRLQLQAHAHLGRRGEEAP